MKLTSRTHAVCAVAAGVLAVSTSAYAAFQGYAQTGRSQEAALPQWLYGVWDDPGFKALSMEILPAGNRFCTRFVKTRGPCSRTPLGSNVIGAGLVLNGNRLSVPEHYRSVGSTCGRFVPIYRVPKAKSQLVLTLVGYRSPGGKAVSEARVNAADCVPPRLWRNRDEERQLKRARTAIAGLRTLDQAKAAGYVEASPCIPGEGAHYIKPSLAQDAVVRPEEPELLMFAPSGDLTGVEYWKADADGNKATTTDRPTLFRHAFDGPMDGHAPDMPVHYDLHVWVGKANPNGLYALPNPGVTC